MKKRSLLVIFLLVFILNIKAQYKVVGYLPAYSGTIGTYINDVDYTKLTHLNIAFFNPDTNGDFPTAKWKDLPEVIGRAHQNNVSVLLSLAGGSDQSQYEKLMGDEYRTVFIDKIMALVEKYNADGIDVDIEGKNIIDGYYEKFVTELAIRLKQKGKLITGAVAWWTRDKITDACLNAYDFINIMAYAGGEKVHASMEYAERHINYWKVKRGLPAYKLALGIGFYGRYDLADRKFKTFKYKDLVAKYPNAANQDSVKNEADGRIIYYNGINRTKAKTQLALKECGGVMIWQLLQDAEGEASLLKAIDDQIREQKSESNRALRAFFGANNQLSLSYLAKFKGPAEVEIYDDTGKKMLSEKLQATSGYNHTILNTNTLPKGIYRVLLNVDKKNINVTAFKN